MRRFIRRVLSLPRVAVRKLRALSVRFLHIDELIDLQTSVLQAAVHLIELQQQQAREMPETHTQVLRQLAELRRQVEALRPGADVERRAA
jgi:hypothetical protein